MYLLIILFVLINSIKSCPLTDNYLSRCHCGILTNGESYIKCEEHSLNHIPTFKRSFPYDELILSNNNIQNLSSTSFDNIKTIKRINLENNSLSFIDNDLLRLLGNYLEELILTGDNHLNSLEFLTRYPLKKLRVLKLNHFNLTEMNFEKIFSNMTKLEIVHLRSCQLKHLPNLSNIQILDLEDNQISNSIILSTSYTHLNLAQNQISTIFLEENSKLLSLNLSKNSLNKFLLFPKTNLYLQELNLSDNFLTSFDFSILNENLKILNLNSNRLLSINLNKIPKNLFSLSLNNNLLKQMKFPMKTFSLSSLDLSSNQLKTVEKTNFFQKLTYLNLENNPLQCNCHLEWLKTLVLSQNFNVSTWSCDTHQTFLSAHFQCLSLNYPRILVFNISYIKISSENGLFIQWKILDDEHLLDYIQISISDPYYLSPKISSNQTEVFLSNSIQSDQIYYICLILVHKYSREKSCQKFQTDKLLTFVSKNNINSIKTNEQIDMNLSMMLIGTCIGGLITFLLIFTCCYLCIKIHKYHLKKKTSNNLSYYSSHPISHSTICPYHNNENLSNSTDSSSLSTNNLKHIYQTIDSQHYLSLQQDTSQLFHLWNQSLMRQKR